MLELVFWPGVRGWPSLGDEFRAIAEGFRKGVGTDGTGLRVLGVDDGRVFDFKSLDPVCGRVFWGLGLS